MAQVIISNAPLSAYGTGELQLQGQALMSATLTNVTDNLNTASPLKLSTALVQTTSTLKITTSDVAYIDAEDNTGNNRFTVSRAVASQLVTVDFASMPTALTTPVGAIRTATDGVNLSNVMTFLENGNIGINTDTPGSKLDVHSGANVIAQFNRTGTGKSWIQYLLAGASKWNTGFDNVNGNYTIYDAVNSLDRMVVTNAGNVGIGTTAPATILNIKGSNATLRIEPSSQNETQAIELGILNGSTNAYAKIDVVNSVSIDTNLRFFTNTFSSTTQVERMRITSTGDVGIGTTAPVGKLQINAQSGVVSPGAIALAIRDANSPTYGFDFDLEGQLTGDLSLMRVVLGVQSQVMTFVRANGNVGIGTATPPSKLSVDGVIRLFDAVITGGGGVELSSEAGFGFTAQAGKYKFRNATNTATYITLDSDGLKFNGDTASANALDDYEEGTWTMGISFGGGTTGITYNGNTGTYTKIGRQVTVNGYIAMTSKGSSTGIAELTGLPFAIPNANQNYASATIWYYLVNFTGQAQSYGVLNQSNIRLNQTTAGVFSNLTDTNFSANSEIMVNFTYFV
jgi:hypothetical protein